MPGSDALHSALTGTNIHVPYRFTYADATAREAEAGAVPGDVGCLALQQDDNSLWILTDDDPLTWVSVADAGGSVVDAGDVTFTPTVATDWDSDADPGSTMDALDQLAERVDDNELAITAIPGGPCFFFPGEQEVADRVAAIIMPRAFTVATVRILVGTAPTGTSLIVDVNKNGTTIFTTQGGRPTIADGETADTSDTPDVTAFAAYDTLSIDVDQIGSTTAGSNLSVTIVGVGA